MKLTKTDMARVVIQALYGLNALPPIDDRRVLRQARRDKFSLTESFNIAMRILEERAQRRATLNPHQQRDYRR